MRAEPVASCSIRFDDPDLHAATKQYAKDERRSVNSSILILLEDALRAKGYLPSPVRVEASAR